MQHVKHLITFHIASNTHKPPHLLSPPLDITTTTNTAKSRSHKRVDLPGLSLSPPADVTSSKIPLGPRSQLQLNPPLPEMYVCTGPLSLQGIRGGSEAPRVEASSQVQVHVLFPVGSSTSSVSLGWGAFVILFFPWCC